MRIIPWFLLIILISCSSDKRTQYHHYSKKKGGYSDAILEDSIHVTRFEANSLTKRSYAEMFARYRTVEECWHEGKSLSHILAVVDKSSTKKITRMNGDYWGPSYYYGMGMSPFYSRYSGFGFSTGINMVNSRAWEETLISPEIEVIYHCTEKIFEPGLEMRDVPPEEMKLLVKDLRGGVQVEKILPDSPNRGLHEGDVIIRADGKRIMKGHQLLALFRHQASLVKIDVLREGIKKELTLKGMDVTENVRSNLVTLKNRACDFRDVKKQSSICREKW